MGIFGFIDRGRTIKAGGSGGHYQVTVTQTPSDKISLDVEKAARQVQLAYNGSDLEYVGVATATDATSSATWKIIKLSYSGGLLTSVKYADGSTLYNKIWDNRGSYTY